MVEIVRSGQNGIRKVAGFEFQVQDHNEPAWIEKINLDVGPPAGPDNAQGTRAPVFNQPRPVERRVNTGMVRAGKWFKKSIISCLLVMESFIF
jgi:hypothetical protein